MSNFRENNLECYIVDGRCQNHASGADHPPMKTPWGELQDATKKGPMAWTVSTPSHGGIWVTAQSMKLIAPAFQKNAQDGCGWFEEDDDFAIPFLALDLHQYDTDKENGEKARTFAIKVLADVHKATPEDVRTKK